jgi:hypothetical protein
MSHCTTHLLSSFCKLQLLQSSLLVHMWWTQCPEALQMPSQPVVLSNTRTFPLFQPVTSFSRPGGCTSITHLACLPRLGLLPTSPRQDLGPWSWAQQVCWRCWMPAGACLLSTEKRTCKGHDEQLTSYTWVPLPGWLCFGRLSSGWAASSKSVQRHPPPSWALLRIGISIGTSLTIMVTDIFKICDGNIVSDCE